MASVQILPKLQSNNFAGGASAVTYGSGQGISTFTAGNTVVLGIVFYGGGTTGRITGITVSGTSAVKVSERSDSNTFNHSEIWVAYNIAGGNANIVVSTAAGSSQYMTLGGEERDDIVNGGLDAIGNTGQTTSSAPSASTSTTTVQGDEVSYAVFCDYVGTNWTSATPPSGYTELWEEPNGSTVEAGSMARKDNETDTAIKTATFATGASMSWISCIATFKKITTAPIASGHGIAYDFLGAGGSSITTSSFTSANGGIMLVGMGRGVLSDYSTATVSDNKSNGNYSQLGTSHAYTNWATSGTALFQKINPLGGTTHTVSATKPTTSDEVTILAAHFLNVNTIVDTQWVEDLTSPNTSANVTTTGPAILFSVWAGDNINGELDPDPGAGWVKLDHTSSLASNHVQLATAYRIVGSAGTYSISWTPSTSQGAQVWLVAMQQIGSVVPTTDVTTTGWVASTGADFFALVDESSSSDTDYFTSPTLGTGGPITLGLSNSLAAGTYQVRIRGRYDVTSGQLRVLLLNDSNTVQGTSNWQVLSNTNTSYNLAITTTGTATRIRIEVQA